MEGTTIHELVSLEIVRDGDKLIGHGPGQGSAIGPRSWHFDGHEFEFWVVTEGTPALLYLAKKARAGDADAAEVLTAFAVAIPCKGGMYWPPEPDAPAVAGG